jgi:hypothetical protein
MKTNHRTKIISFLFLICGINVFSQDITIWPQINGVVEFNSGWQRRGYYIIDDNGGVTISDDRSAPSITTLIIDDDNGELIATDRGEWGGELYFINNDEKKNNIGMNGFYLPYSYEYIIIKENTRYLFTYNNEIYALTGLAHMSTNVGKIIKLRKNNGIYSIDSIIELDSEPQAFKIYNGIIYILTFHKLITFDGENIKEIISDQDWGYSAGKRTSIFINEEIIGLGLRDHLIIIKDNIIKRYR